MNNNKKKKQSNDLIQNKECIYCGLFSEAYWLAEWLGKAHWKGQYSLPLFSGFQGYHSRDHSDLKQIFF